MFDNSYLKSAGQMWKFYLFFLSFPAIGLGLVTLSLKGVAGENLNLSILLVLFGLGLALSGLVLGFSPWNVRNARLAFSGKL